MSHSVRARLMPTGLLLLCVATLAAQSVPQDSDQWRDRCSSLVQSGGVPSPDGSGIPALRLEQLARDRSEQGQHFVACTLFMFAAGEQAAGSDAQRSRDDILLARIEQKMALGQKLSFVERLTRSSDLIANLQTAAPPNQNEMYAMDMMGQTGGAVPPAPGAYPPSSYPPNYNEPSGPPAPAYSPAPPYSPVAGQYPPPQQSGMGAANPYSPMQPAGSVPEAPYASSAPQQYAPPNGIIQQPAAAESTPAYGASQPPQYGEGLSAQAPAAPIMQAPPAPSAPYTPLALGDNLANNAARGQWALNHVTAAGTPAACQRDWQTQASALAGCATAYDQQAAAEQAARNYNAALEDYDNAKLAAAAAGTWNTEMMGQMSHRTAIQNALHPPAANPAYGRAGLVPVGHYLCFQAAVVIANGMGNSDLTVQSPQQDGEMWVYDATHYAGSGGGKGRYHMQGNQLVADSGPYVDSPTHDPVRMTYIAKGAFGRPTVRLDFYSPASGKEDAATNCQWQDKN